MIFSDHSDLSPKAFAGIGGRGGGRLPLFMPWQVSPEAKKSKQAPNVKLNCEIGYLASESKAWKCMGM